MKFDKNTTALLLIGYQNDYFSEDGILTGVVDETLKELNVLDNTLHLIQNLPEEVLIVSTPIIFSDDYSELLDPVGILDTIKTVGAFKTKTKGAQVIPEIIKFGERILEIPGKHGLNAFVGTSLENTLQKNNIKTIILAGCVCSICIDSTGRSAFDKDYSVIMASDCISGRTIFEQNFYCTEVFPLYSNVLASKEILNE